MGAKRVVDYIFRVRRDDISPRFRSLERDEKRFMSRSRRSWGGYERQSRGTLSRVGGAAKKQHSFIGGKMALLSGKMAAGLGAFGAGMVIKSAITGFAAFEDQMSGLAIKMKLPLEKLGELRDEIESFSRERGIISSAKDLASSMNVLVGADFNQADALEITKASAKGAAASLSNVSTVTMGLMSVMKGFKIPASDAEKMLSKMIVATDIGVIEMGNLSNAMSDVVAPAIRAGATIEQTLGMLETLSISGVSNAAEASTSVAALLRRFATNDFVRDARSYGLQVLDEKGNFKDVMDVMNMLQKKYKELDSDVERNSFVEKVIGKNIRAQRAFIPLISSIDTLNESIKKIVNAGDRLPEAFDEAAKRTSAKLAQFKNSVESIKNDLAVMFSEPLSGAAETVSEMADLAKEKDLITAGLYGVGAATIATGNTINDYTGVTYLVKKISEMINPPPSHTEFSVPKILFKDKINQDWFKKNQVSKDQFYSKLDEDIKKFLKTKRPMPKRGNINLKPEKSSKIDDIKRKIAQAPGLQEKKEIIVNFKPQLTVNTKINLDPVTGKQKTEVVFTSPDVVSRVPITE